MVTDISLQALKDLIPASDLIHEPNPYWRLARKVARQRTKNYSIWKAVPSCVAAVAQWRYFAVATMKHALITVATLFGAYGLLWILEYLRNLLFSAPRAVYARCAAEIDAIGCRARSDAAASREEVESLRRQLAEPKTSAIEQARRDHVAEVLRDVGEEELRVLSYLVQHGRTDVTVLRNMFSNTVPVNNMLVAGLVRHVPATLGSPEFQQYYEINQRLLDALTFHLHVRGV